MRAKIAQVRTRLDRGRVPRAFRTPLVPLVPLLGIFTCLFMMVFLPLDTWIRLFVWLLIGFIIYFGYSAKNSKLRNPGK